VAENIPGDEMPMFRNLWENIRKDMPRKGRGQSEELDPLKLPTRLQTALLALYGHYEKTFKLWEEKGIKVPPCFIIVCQNTAISKLVYDFISGFHRKKEDGITTLENGRLPLFRNFDDTTGNPLPRPNTLLIDSEQLEAGDALDDNFRGMAAEEIERFRREIMERTGDARAGENITDQELLREVMNTVGKLGQLGGSIRCVVSVSMLTEGWDASTVTHVLGIRAFGTQLLCEQVIGRALRRQSYDENEEGLFNVEYADVFGVPFDFTAKPIIAPPQPPRETVQVRAISPERDALEIRFPRVEGYRVELPEERLTADFNEDSILELSPDLVGPSITRNSGIIGEGVDMSLTHLADMRPSSLVFHVTQRLLYTKWRDPDEEPKLHLFGQLKRITKQWLDTCLVCKGDTYPALLMYQELADMACNRITAAITRQFLGDRPIKTLLDPYNHTGSTRHVRFNTSRADRWDTSGPPPKNHVNWGVLDSDWESEFCRVAAVLAAFGARYLSTMKSGVLVFLDVEPEHSLSANYYRGWSEGIISAGSVAMSTDRGLNVPIVKFLPCVYMKPSADIASLRALLQAVTRGAKCSGVWITRQYVVGCDRPRQWDASFIVPKTLPRTIPVWLWQWVIDCQRLDLNIVNPDLHNEFLLRCILPQPKRCVTA
jgi:type III restriction enzyme